ncbi:MAG: UvrD-helicase domain-containing protein [Flavobacteriales bacterium]|nr:UvrD-helicase domain-containing protein [Flavobacteriales bacterium]
MAKKSDFEPEFLIVRASAGSGKTFRLVQEYLRCCLRFDDPGYFRKILAITFTNKAAQEMKDRVLSDVREVAQGKGSMFEEMVAALQLDPDEIQRRAEKLGQSILHRYEDFGVMTIDSFVNRLVRSFSRDLEWDDAFQIELDEGRLIEEAVDRVLSKVGSSGEKALTFLMEGFVRQQVEEERNTQLRSQLIKFGKQVTREHMQPILEALDPKSWPPERFEEYRKEMRAHMRTESVIPVEKAKEALRCIHNAGLTDQDFSYGDLPKWLRKVAKGGGEKAKIGTRLQDQFEQDDCGKSSADGATQDAMSSVMPVILVARDAWELLYTGEFGGHFKLLGHLQERVSLIGTLALIRDELDAVQSEGNVRLLSTLNREIADLVRNNPAPYIFERLGNRYQHIFIDEFQDTSITQWHNLVQLFEHILSTRNMGMVVGDGKQAIYRWRNGNYEQLQALPSLIGNPSPILIEAAQSLDRSKIELDLESNWRSGVTIVDWNNRLFRRIQGVLPDALQSVYDAPDQKAEQSFFGEVNASILVDKKADDRELGRHAWVLQRILSHTGGCIEERDGVKHFIPSQESKMFDLSDIAVLMRRNRDGAALAQFLLNHGITPFTSESLHLGRHPAPRGVVALLRTILEPNDPRHVIVFLQCYAALQPEVSEAALLWKHTKVKEILMKNGGKFERGEIQAEDLIHELAPTLDLQKRSAEPLVALVGHSFDALGWSQSYPSYAEGMLELAHEVSSQRRTGLHAFLEMWDRRGHQRSIRVSGSQQAVQIMTPHKAKGLAFPVVIAPLVQDKISAFKDELPVPLDLEKYGLPAALLRDSDLKNTPLNHHRQQEIDRTLLDALNVAYVTMTRAIERLDVLLEFEKEDDGIEEPKSLPQILKRAMELEFPSDKNNEGVFQLGRRDRKEQKVGEESSEIIPREVALQTGEPLRQLVVHSKGAWAEAMPGGELSHQTFGNAVHGLLALVTHVDEWSHIQPRVGTAFGMDQHQREEVISAVEGVLHHGQMKRFFETRADQLFAERDLRKTDGKVGRPDRVVRLDDGWHVIDYKTGRPDPKHHEQVTEYAAAIQEMDTKIPVFGWLIYTRKLILEEVLWNG